MGGNLEIEIYIKKLEKFLSVGHTASYFYKETDKEIFLAKVRETAGKNLEEHGAAELTKEQLEEIRINVRYKPIIRDSIIQYDNIGIIYLN